jgi:hypothetical protein
VSERISVKVDDLTIEQIETIEDVLDLPIDEVFKEKRRGRTMRAIAYAVKRSEDPTFSWEAAGRLVLDVSGGDDEERPTEASA